MALRVACILLTGFVLVSAAVLVAGELPGDEGALTLIHDQVGDDLDGPMRAVADASDVGPLALVAAVVVGLLVWRGRTADALAVVAAVGVVWVVNPVLK